VTLQLSRRRKFAYASAAAALIIIAMTAALLGIDVILHWKVEDLAAVNVWGYRGPTIGRKQAGEQRVVVLGGSTAFGYGLPYNESFPFYLERLLARQASAPRSFRVVNLGAPAQGAFGFLYDLEDYAYLQYDLAIFYEGYNDLGMQDLPDSVPPREGPNVLLWRRESPVFRAIGYFPVLPLVFREKAMALRAGGQLDAAYRGKAVFKPGLAARASAAALQGAAAVADRLGSQLGRLSADSGSQPFAHEDVETWRHYTSSVLAAVEYARQHRVKVVVVTQPYASDTHVRQQKAMAAALDARYGGDAGVRYVNLGRLIDLHDHSMAYDGLHLVAAGNAKVAAELVDPVLGLLTQS
jgi:hypothetical protein